MPNAILILAVASLITSILNLMGKCPSGVPLILLSIIALVTRL